MPETITIYEVGVWFCVGLFTGAGWTIGVWLMGKVIR